MKNLKAMQPTLTLEQTDEIILTHLQENDFFAMIEEAEDYPLSVVYFLDDGSTATVSKRTGKITIKHFD